jgi:type VI secretion system protein ImpC
VNVPSQRFIARHRAPRVKIQYTLDVSGDERIVELPFVVGVLADLSGNPAEPLPELADRKFIHIDLDNFDQHLRNIKPRVAFTVPNTLSGEGLLPIEVTFESLDDFSPAALAQRIPFLEQLFKDRQLLNNLQTYLDGKEQAQQLIERITQDTQLIAALARLKDGLDDDEVPVEVEDRFRDAGMQRSDLTELIEKTFGTRIDSRVRQIGHALVAFAKGLLAAPYLGGEEIFGTLGALVAEFDKLIGELLNAVLHHPQFQAMEATWRGLRFLVERTETDEMLKIRVLNVSKRDLAKNLRKYAGSAWDKSPLFKKVYSQEYDQVGGEPFALLVGDYYFDHSPPDVELLRHIARIAATSHALFIAAAEPALMQMSSWQEISNPRDLKKIFDTPEYAAWRNLRERPESNYIALTLPRFLARLPYGERRYPTEEMPFEEDAHIDDITKCVWINAAHAMATNITRAFKRYGWCTRIHGFEDGSVQHLPVFSGWNHDGTESTLGPVEVLIDDRRESELASLGLLPLVQRKNTDIASFSSAQSLQKPIEYDDPNVTDSARISARVPFVLASARFAHYLKCIFRDRDTSWAHPGEATRFLNDWIKDYVDDNPEISSQTVKAQRPLATGEVTVRENSSGALGFECRFFVRPHYQIETPLLSVRLNVQLPTSTHD